MYKRRFLDPEKNGSELKFNPTCDLRNVVLRDSSVIDEFYTNKTTNPDGSESIQHVDPIYVLFNQHRLESIGTSAVQHFLDSLQSSNDSLAELRKKCSDDDLMKMIKSKYLQSPAEILAWCRYMDANVEEFNKEVQTLIEAQKQEQPVAPDQQTTE